ncbi:formylglycine-generating enzyme family protein [Nocardioides sp. cx-169]|uniref:formylglycine-generating enzyme family protein n=1 Tax=Nocardioides sp. cx-169 TaxID=2899080 RepID=UPI001E4AA2C9|nr:SUMF1/EgtB/PvdO family nonheme iron enzyme [Nocardioides sp. cx-169]MCD4534251.1 formylglycine-generating enzyme family protein [Nocardioides sp. cx-169]
MTSAADEAHFSVVLPLALNPLLRPPSTVDQCRTLLESDEGTPSSRIAAGAVFGLHGDTRAPRIPRFTRVPGGSLRMGTPDSKVDSVVDSWRHVGVERAWIAKEAPAHSADVATFWLGTYPVTNHQYACFLQESGQSGVRPSTWLLGAYPWDRSNHPVAGVGPRDAEAYCDWLTEQTDVAIRLPTEEEWEYAARGSDGREFPWGEQFRADAGNVREFGLTTTSPIGSFPAGRSWCGVWDLAGNVEEFTSTLYHAYDHGGWVADDLTELLGDYPVTRGGSFSRFGDLARCARRHGPHPGELYPCGFRVAADTDPCA